MLARRSLAMGLLLTLALPALAISPVCACPRTSAVHSCCRPTAPSLTVTAPRGCCQVTAPARPVDADLSARTLAPSRQEPARLLVADDTAKGSLHVAHEGRRIPSLREAAETPPDLHVRNCALLI